MVQRGRETTFEERIEIGERWEAGQTDPEIAAAMGRRVPTVRKWRGSTNGRGARAWYRVWADLPLVPWGSFRLRCVTLCARRVSAALAGGQ